MYVIGHYRVWRNRFYAAPFQVEAFDDAFECPRDVALYKAAVVADLRKLGDARLLLERHHVEVWRLVVEIAETCHENILPYFSHERSAA